MRFIHKSLVAIGCLASVASATAMNSDLEPYIGLDYYSAYMDPRHDWNLIFPKTYPGAAIYLGAKFHDNFALEAGYFSSTKRGRSWNLPAGTPFFGTNVVTPIQGTVNLRRYGAYVDLIAFLPTVECFELTGSIGYGWVQPKIIFKSFSVPPGQTVNTSALASVSGKGKGVVRGSIGGLYMLTEVLGLRAKINWEGTTSIRVDGNALFHSLGYSPKAFKLTTAFSGGAFIKF